MSHKPEIPFPRAPQPMKPRLIIEMDSSGAVTMNGPINNRIIVGTMLLGALEIYLLNAVKNMQEAGKIQVASPEEMAAVEAARLAGAATNKNGGT